MLHLNAFLMGVGHHEAAWRHPRTDERRVLDAADDDAGAGMGETSAP